MAVTKFKRIVIHNYKSLRSVELYPAETDFTVLVGRNGSGKSNLADAFDFIQLVYKVGLEHAVARKGGYENIAHRKERRSRTAISFEVELSHTTRMGEVLSDVKRGVGNPEDRTPVTVIVKHKFSFKAVGSGIRSEFSVSEESLETSMVIHQQDLFGGNPSDVVRISRMSDNTLKAKFHDKSKFAEAVLFDPRFWRAGENGDTAFMTVPSTELLSSFPYLRSSIVGLLFNWLQRVSVFQLAPSVARAPGVPTPNPSLAMNGENLPAVIDWMTRNHQSEWNAVISTMREIVPEIESIYVDYLHSRTLGLFFKETGVGRAWTSDEVSDGTIRSLAMLVACHDPRASALLIEEPENSLHPWIMKIIMSSLRRISSKKPIIITTHSPLILNSVAPQEVWVAYKEDGETRLSSLVAFDDNLNSDWESGKYKLFDYLDSGYVTQAVPSGSGR
ncbi:AAA family ATPase [Pseudoxanthomonas beigongshangi]